LNADVFSHASGRTVGGVVEQQSCPDLIAAGTFWFSAFTNNSSEGRGGFKANSANNGVGNVRSNQRKDFDMQSD